MPAPWPNRSPRRWLIGWLEVIEKTVSAEQGVRLMTVLDEDYPVNLRRIYNRPPFLFVRGTLDPADAKSVAVVGTRRA